jgi:hypothetical protein
VPELEFCFAARAGEFSLFNYSSIAGKPSAD